MSAVAEDMRWSWPARPPSPKKSPSPRIARVASFPTSDTTLSRTLPFWTKNKPSEKSPCAKMDPFFWTDTMFLPSPMVERKAWGLKARLEVALAGLSKRTSPDDNGPSLLSMGREEWRAMLNTAHSVIFAACWRRSAQAWEAPRVDSKRLFPSLERACYLRVDRGRSGRPVEGQSTSGNLE